MEQRERPFYAFRPQTLAHSGLIHDPSTEAKRAKDLVEQTFGHHVAVFDPNSRFPNLKTLDHEPASAEMAARFYMHHYIDANLHRGMALDSPVSYRQFLDEVVLARGDGRRNNISYLVGEVGTGKTAFINYFITRHGADLVQNRSMWFLRIDVDIYGGADRVLQVGDLVAGISQKLIQIFDKHSNLLPLPLYLQPKLDLIRGEAYKGSELLEQHVAEFVNAFASITGKTLFLMIDNLDYLYHLHDRVAFSQSSFPMGKEAIRFVSDIVAAFRHDGRHRGLSDMGANVLFSLRGDSYDILRESTALFHPNDEFQNDPFAIKAPQWDDVVEQRGNLLHWAIASQPLAGRRRVQEQIIAPIIADLEHTPEHGRALIYHLLNITNFGLRDIIDFLSHYSWLGSEYEPDRALGYERLLRSYPVGVLVYILNNRRMYGQETSRFPNIYVVPGHEDWEPTSVPPGGSSAIRYPHSYWLNRLILQYIQTSEDAGEQVGVQQLLDTFCGDTKAYPESLVRASLGNMARTHVTNLIQVTKVRATGEQHLTIRDVSLTRRARHCLREVFDRFFYLQLAVDDPLLPIPRTLLLDFRFEGVGLDYNYLCEPPRVYREKLTAMIRRKAGQVALFIEALASSLELERIRYATCFGLLSQLGVAIPDMAELRKAVQTELRHLTDRHPGMLAIEPVFKNAREARPRIDEALKQAYSPQTASSK